DNIDKEKGFSIKKFVIDVLDNLQDEDLLNKEAVISSIANSWIKNYYKSEKIKPFLFKETTQSIYLNEFLKFHVPVKMISIIRDPRDNYAAIKAGVSGYYSKMNESEKESLASVINRARMDLRSAANHQSERNNVFLAVRFEDLVNETNRIMLELCEFLNIKFQSILPLPTELGRNYYGNSHDGKIFNGIFKKNVGGWKSRISKDEAMIIEYWMADVMRVWNYPLAFSTSESENAISQFYNWYNSRYFYRDSFKLL
ncbi:MAG: sulfotransferase, partial [Saprospiraceae bacterium]|nr:sulfotransferase [Saprospiraceae bacterium]